MILSGVAAGTAGVLAAARFLDRLVEGMEPTGLSTFAITIPVLVICALFASYLPARRASQVDPVTALRRE